MLARSLFCSLYEGNVKADLQMVGTTIKLLKQLEANLVREAKLHNPKTCSLLRTILGIG